MAEIENLPTSSTGGTGTTSEPKETTQAIGGTEPGAGKDVTPKGEEKPGDKLSTAMQKLARQEAAVRQEKVAARKEAEEARSQTKQLEATLAETNKKLAELSKREEAFQELMEGDPITALQNLNIDFEKLVERIAGAGSPESMARAMKREMERQVKGLEEKFSKQEEAQKKAAEAKQAEEKNYELASRRKACADKVFAESDRYPHLSLEDGPEVAFMIEEKALEKYNEYGEANFTFDEIAQEVEDALAAREAERANRRAKRTPGQQAPASATTPGSTAKTSSPDRTGQDDGGADEDLVKLAQTRRAAAKQAKKPKSLTNKDAGQSVTWRRREESRHDRALRAGKLISDG